MSPLHKVGHIACMCRNKKTPQDPFEQEAETSLADEDNENLFGLYTVYTASDGNGYMVDLNIESQNTQMQLDTGACVSLVSEITDKGSLTHLPLCPCKVPLSTFSGEPIPV